MCFSGNFELEPSPAVPLAYLSQARERERESGEKGEEYAELQAALLRRHLGINIRTRASLQSRLQRHKHLGCTYVHTEDSSRRRLKSVLLAFKYSGWPRKRYVRQRVCSQHSGPLQVRTVVQPSPSCVLHDSSARTSAGLPRSCVTAVVNRIPSPLSLVNPGARRNQTRQATRFPGRRRWNQTSCSHPPHCRRRHQHHHPYL